MRSKIMRVVLVEIDNRWVDNRMAIQTNRRV